MAPKIAICARPMLSLGETLAYAGKNGYSALDWSFDSEGLSVLDKDGGRFKVLLEGPAIGGVEVRYHCFLEGIELAHIDPHVAEESLSILKFCVNKVREFGGGYVTVHIGLWAEFDGEISWDRAVENLSRLVDYGNARGIVVCLENLKAGLTSDPGLFLKLVELTGAKVTFDLGHANSSLHARNGCSGLDFLKMVSLYVTNAHVYEAENPYHIAPQDLSVIGPMLEHLLQTNCGWWVIELENKQEVEYTRTLLQSFLNGSQ
ncbi:MAG: TIM barrel protein [Actinomycetota bacterium]|nr:TIM barrel protein [Actinomycetota bacterium]